MTDLGTEPDERPWRDRPPDMGMYCERRLEADECVGSMKIVVPIKQVAALDDEFELLDDGSGVDPDFARVGLNEWDTFSLEAALQLRDDAGGEGRGGRDHGRR